MSLATYFEDLHAAPDPFGYRGSWYEQRKRQLLLACLPQAHYARGWELGCSSGVLTAELAARCTRLLATDLSANAVAQARRAVAGLAHVEVRQARHPGQWPDGRFDLVVCSEMAYYLAPDDLPALRAGLHAALAGEGLLVACHWRVPFAQAGCSAAAVHACLGDGLHELFIYRDDDFVLQGWARAPASVAAREGLR